MSQILNTSIESSWKEADRLISILRGWGIEYLIGLEQASSQVEELDISEFIKRLAQTKTRAYETQVSPSSYFILKSPKPY